MDNMDTQSEIPVPEQTTGVNDINLPTGKPLTSEEANHIVRSTGAPIVLLIGAVKSGKTTLIASIHDAFQWMPFANYLAAGSETLIGFEERCFDSRAVSGAEEPTTIRTIPAEGIQFYHLKLRDQNMTAPIRHLLLADMSGEIYEQALDSSAVMRGLSILTRADHLVYLVDGAKLYSEEFKHHTRTNALMLMRRCFEQNMIRTNARVDVLLTKWDIVLKQSSQNVADQFLKEYKNLFNKEWGAKLGRLNVLPIAARPHYKSTLTPCYGLTEILHRWVEEWPVKLQSARINITVHGLTRMIDKFAMSTAEEMFEDVSYD